MQTELPPYLTPRPDLPDPDDLPLQVSLITEEVAQHRLALLRLGAMAAALAAQLEDIAATILPKIPGGFDG
jgi:hypothetical protein